MDQEDREHCQQREEDEEATDTEEKSEWMVESIKIVVDEIDDRNTRLSQDDLFQHLDSEFSSCTTDDEKVDFVPSEIEVQTIATSDDEITDFDEQKVDTDKKLMETGLLNAKVLHLEMQAKHSSEQIRKLEAEKTETVANNQSLQKQVEIMKKEKTFLADKSAMFKEKNNKLQTQVSNLQAMMKSKEDDNTMQSKQIEELLVSEDALQNKLSEVETLLKAKQEEIEMKSGYLGYNELLDKNLELENQLQAVMADKEVESLKQQRDKT